MKNQTSTLLFSELLPAATDTFYGRVNELLTIEKALDPTKLGQKGIVLWGIGGSGKTQLALRYIKQHPQLYTAIIWIDASTAESTRQSFAEALNVILSNWPTRDLPIAYTGSSAWRKVIARLRSTCHTRWLLVIDSVDDLNRDDFAQYIPSCNYGSVIVTSTQSRAPEVFGLPELEVDSLELDCGCALLFARACSSIGSADVSEDGKNCSCIV
jgi:hypothetical protein